MNNEISKEILKSILMQRPNSISSTKINLTVFKKTTLKNLQFYNSVWNFTDFNQNQMTIEINYYISVKIYKVA